MRNGILMENERQANRIAAKVMRITFLTVAGASLGQILAFLLDTLPDKNFPVLNEVIVYSVVPKALVLIAVASIFTMRSNRTAAMLSSLMGAEQQKEMLDSMTIMREKACRTRL